MHSQGPKTAIRTCFDDSGRVSVPPVTHMAPVSEFEPFQNRLATNWVVRITAPTNSNRSHHLNWFGFFSIV